MADRKIRIGTYCVREARDVTEHYECAAWHKTIRCEPGVYDAFAYPYIYDGRLGHSIYVPVSGPVTSAYFRSQWCGVPFGEDHGGKEAIGKVETISIKLGEYCMDDYVQAGDLVLDMDVIALSYTYESQGKQHQTYKLK